MKRSEQRILTIATIAAVQAIGPPIACPRDGAPTRLLLEQRRHLADHIS
jgi:hypothetical protein